VVAVAEPEGQTHHAADECGHTRHRPHGPPREGTWLLVPDDGDVVEGVAVVELEQVVVVHEGPLMLVQG
jgi:hypothetical protein